MTHAFTALSDADLSAGKKITQAQGRALRDNPLAIAEGDASAPRINIDAAMETAETDTTKRLAPDGAGGVAWAAPAPPPVCLTSFGPGPSIPTASLTGKWLVTGLFSGGGAVAMAYAIVTNGAITTQIGTDEGGVSKATPFVVSGGNLQDNSAMVGGLTFISAVQVS